MPGIDPIPGSVSQFRRFNPPFPVAAATSPHRGSSGTTEPAYGKSPSETLARGIELKAASLNA
jgi:hypothetical protein